MATVNALALDLITEAGESTSQTAFVTLVEKRVNEALHEIGLATNFNPFKARDTFSTGVATPQYNLPATAREIIQLQFVVDGQPIAFATTQELARRGLKLTDPGRPQFWLEDGVVQSVANNLLRIRLVPVPVAIESVEREFYFDSTDAASASHLQVPDSFLVTVKDRVRSFLKENLGKYDASALDIRRYENNLKRLTARENGKVAEKIILAEVDLARSRRRRGPRLPGSYPDWGW